MTYENLEGRTPGELNALSHLAENLEISHSIDLNTFVGALPAILARAKETGTAVKEIARAFFASCGAD